MRFGCVYFDDFGSEGWACIASEEPRRITGSQDLASDVMWVTNLDWEGMRQKSILDHPRFRADNFLRSRLSSLSLELDMSNDGDVATRVQVFAEIIDRVCRLAESIFGVTEFKKDLPSSLREAILTERDLRSYGSPVVDYAIEHATQSYQKCETPIQKGSKFYTWRFPRLDYAEYIFGFQIPTSRWTRVDIETVPDVKQYLNEHLNDYPMLCKIVISSIKNPTFAKIMPLGFGARQQRVWATGQEVLHYMRYSDVAVSNIFRSDGYRELNLRLPSFDNMTGKISISMGILSECCWKALSAKLSPRAAWYTSWDRISCCKTAMTLAEAGISVVSYSTGSLTLAIHPNQYEYTFEQCLKLGLTPPLNMIAHMNAM